MKNTKLSIAILMTIFMVNCAESSNNKSSYPNKVVSVIVPYSAGGGSDITTRALVEGAKTEFPKGISVENRTGGAGIIGMSYGSKAKSDGYTITMIAPEILILPHMGAGAGLVYSNLKPIILYNAAYSAITVDKNSPFNTLEELITATKTQNIQIGNSGVGSIWHLAAAGLAKEAGVTFTYIPFEGAAPAVTDLLGGHIDAVSVSYPEVAAQVDAGALKVLAILGPQRIDSIPNIPTAKELGYNVEIGTWRALAVPTETPDEIVTKLYNIFSKAVTTDTFNRIMKESNNPIVILNGDDTTTRMQKEDELFKGLVTDLGLSINK